MSSDGSDTAFAVAAVMGAVSLTVLTVNLVYTGHRDRARRRRKTYSKAFRAVAEYEEFPYVVRRRRASAPNEERLRISTELREVQKTLAYYSAWLRTESNRVADSYDRLVGAVRAGSGASIREAWSESPTDSDEQMNVGDLGIADSSDLKQAFLLTASDHLSIWPMWLRRFTRFVT